MGGDRDFGFKEPGSSLEKLLLEPKFSAWSFLSICQMLLTVPYTVLRVYSLNDNFQSNLLVIILQFSILKCFTGIQSTTIAVRVLAFYAANPPSILSIHTKWYLNPSGVIPKSKSIYIYMLDLYVTVYNIINLYNINI